MSASADNYRRTIIKGFVSGLGWAVGASIGFTIFLTFIGSIFTFLNHVPVVGNIIAPFEKLFEDSTSPKQNFKPVNNIK